MDTKPQDRAKVKRREVYDLARKQLFTEMLIREFGSILTPPEFVVLLAIANETIFWNEPAKRIRRSRLVEGNPPYSWGLRMKGKNFSDIVGGLEHMGIVRRTDGKYESEYEILIHPRYGLGEIPEGGNAIEFLNRLKQLGKEELERRSPFIDRVTEWQKEGRRKEGDGQ